MADSIKVRSISTGTRPALTFALERPGAPATLTVFPAHEGGVVVVIQRASGERRSGRLSTREFRRLLREGAELLGERGTPA